ncbi:hypothetical protein DPEC_G00030620, partial [Dallia pectoralis]
MLNTKQKYLHYYYPGEPLQDSNFENITKSYLDQISGRKTTLSRSLQIPEEVH